MRIRSWVTGRNYTDRKPNPRISTEFGGITGYFPVIPEGWKADFNFIILDETVLQTSVTPPPEDSKVDSYTVFEHVLRRCGEYVGIGRFRPRNRGFYGRFRVNDFMIVDV